MNRVVTFLEPLHHFVVPLPYPCGQGRSALEKTERQQMTPLSLRAGEEPSDNVKR